MSINTRLPNEDPAQDLAPEQISALLTLSAEQLDSSTVAQLQRARQAALAKQAAEVEVFALAGGRGIHWPIPQSARYWTAILLVVAIAGTAGYWQHHWKHEKMAHLDVAILTDDMPMEVFVDHLSE
jgi:hypothetical protein